MGSATVRVQSRPVFGHFARVLSAITGLAPVLLTAMSSQYAQATTALKIEGDSGKTFEVPWDQIEPDELLVVVNTADQQSEDVADEYMSKYHIPSGNRLRLSFPKTEVMLGHDFDSVFDTIDSYLRSKPQLQAIVVTWTKPWKVAPPGSEAGMGLTSAITFGFKAQYYNDSGNSCDVTAMSPFYGEDLSAPYTDFGLRPAMMLAGENTSKALDVVHRSIDAKSTFPLPTGYLVRTTDEDRSVRYYQMVQADDFWTSTLGLQIDYRDNSDGPEGNDYIKNRDDVLYYFTGLTDVDFLNTLTFVPGAVADHLTSFGGKLTDTHGQMSILRWLEAGASGSYGTVAEPCNFADKFTNVSMFLQRYFAGAPLIDAYWYSVHEPGEGIFVGDPMTQPYAPKAKLNNAGQIEFTTTGLVARHVYKVTGISDGGSSVVLLNGVHMDGPDLRVLQLPAGFDTYKLIDTGTTYDDHGAPHLNSGSVSRLRLPGNVYQFDIRADDPHNDQVYYSLQLANGKLLSQSNDFTAGVYIDGDLNGDGYVNFTDLGLLKEAMYAAAGDANYLSAADLNNDGVVNFLDLGMLKNNFGGTRSYVRITSHIDGTKTLLIKAFDKWGSESDMKAKVGDRDLVVLDP
jgi:uncharacterized protein (TIGR03790 family)